MNEKSPSLSLATGGRKRKLIVHDHNIKKEISFSEESLDDFRVKLAASQNQMRKITNFLRSHVGRKSIPINYNQHMSHKSKALKDIYNVGSYEFNCENSSLKQQRPLIYADAEELLDSVIEQRNIVGNCTIKVMADGGQGFLRSA